MMQPIAWPDFSALRTPCHVIDLGLLERNFKILKSVQTDADCRILLALKGFAAWSTFDLARHYLAGVTASSLNEALLGQQEFGGEVHLCAPAFRPDEINAFAQCVDHVVFNSIGQWQRLGPALQAGPRPVSCGLRVNPEHSEVSPPIYDPCAPKSRLGITLEQCRGLDLTGIEGLHFHTLCEVNADALERTLSVVEEKFTDLLSAVRWINFGGGHHITRPDYDLARLVRLIREFKAVYPVSVYMEPGEAVGLNTGYLVASVLDIIHNQMDIAILDTSAAAHMPDVLEMPYRPRIEGAGDPGQFPHLYRLGGNTCLAGDIIGDYSFPEPLTVGSQLIFHDMTHYTMVKNNTFNGLNLPDIVLYDPQSGAFKLQRRFGYDDYKGRLS